jgi:hypothetical protein
MYPLMNEKQAAMLQMVLHFSGNIWIDGYDLLRRHVPQRNLNGFREGANT